MLFRQLFDSESCTYTYLVADEVSGEAALIDPVREQLDRDLRLVGQLGLTLRYVLDTHVHADHITAAGELRDRTGAQTVSCLTGGADCASLRLGHGSQLHLSSRPGGLLLKALATPGHTDDSLSFLIEDRVFTGDALLIRGCGRTDFQNGSPGQLYDSITQVLFALPASTKVYPAHDYCGQTMSTIAEEQRYNPRLAGKSRDEFIALMNNLHLAPPKKLHLAVPANRACGKDPLPQGG
jgi:glyoxylase-like metal-dependent hydrolase (beta-lactamase superfamily II)